ncbi:ABC transporter substrate-binding protein [uncultured Pseudacidovorax sp.]|uniref:ABC transporter substrate-binding protein n=1 Tax=uncultured Pseudacidovorax sp. TaxID=679313 RepID=UPI0025EB0892|nr:ABC transporter substrate-binding protein [uncultured Pseudacidovorax sp.]
MPDTSSFDPTTRDVPVRRRRLLQTGAALAASAWTAQATATQPERPLQIVGPWELAGLAPAKSGHVFTRLQIAETLTDAQDDGTPLPGLAERWTVSADGLTWRFVLRARARFHDGTAVDAAAVVRCLALARTPPAMLSLAPIEAVEAEGDRTVRIRLARPHGGLPSLLAHSSTLILAPSSVGGQDSVRRIVGSGPYRVASISPPQLVEAERFDGYDGRHPAIARVRYLAAGRSETRALMAEGGQADLAFGLDPASIARLRLRRQVSLASVTLPRTVMIKLNAGLPALRDVRVRQALSLAIDRVGIARAVLRDPELAATQLFAPTLGGWHDASLPPLQHDPARAARLLTEAGWQRGPDGLRDARGEPLRLAMRTFPDRPELPIIASALQEQWRQLGVAVQVSVGNSGEIPLGHRDGSLQLGLAARNYASVPDPTGTLMQDFGPRGGDWGAMGWQDAALLTALEALAAGTLPSPQRDATRARVADILQAQLPVVPVVWQRQQVAVSRRVTGVSLDPLERSYRLLDMGWQS